MPPPSAIAACARQCHISVPPSLPHRSTLPFVRDTIINAGLGLPHLGVEIWTLQDGTTVVVGGKINRTKLEFPKEMNRLLGRGPELVEDDDTLNR